MIKYRKQSGFSLIETFVAITILVIAVLGPMTLFSTVIADGIFAKNQVISFYLAQEGLELAMAHRNEHGKWWHTDSGASYVDCESGCLVYFDENSGSSLDPNPNDLDYLKYDVSTGVYGYDDGEDTIFQRFIYTEPIDVLSGDFNDLGDNNGVEVISRVYWTYRGSNRVTEISTFLYAN